VVSKERVSPGLKNKKGDNFSEWYNELVIAAGLADFAPIAGCMSIKPYGYSIWESIQFYFDKKIKETGHVNAYFPMFIPESLLKKEAEHFSGFVPEVAMIDKKGESGERYALRPTSETIICDSYSKWIRSWRDLPVKINQWCNIVRWETKATRLFLRTREFLWQECHTAHRTHKEAEQEAFWALNAYKDLMENQLAIAVMVGEKTKKERFAGALKTFTLESLMPDGKALQMGTSHDMGQNFSRPFKISFIDRDEKEKYVWQTSWGITTRLIGAIIMVHGDDKGLVMPPRIAPLQIVVIPIPFENEKKKIMSHTKKVTEKLNEDFMVKLDDRKGYSPGYKFNDWEMRGIPIRIEIGPREVKEKSVLIARRDNGEKKAVPMKAMKKTIEKTLEMMHKDMLKRSREDMKNRIKDAKNFTELEDAIRKKQMARIGWCGDSVCEDKIQEGTAATIRLIPLRKESVPSKCAVCNKKAKHVVYISRQY